ncbi:MAG: O-antigen ligase family protein [Tannerella sp.]|jgi:tetratricopeptide (TPR) repeat protein|nr:O-antigen ligase family protein [Tannerella sp.]
MNKTNIYKNCFVCFPLLLVLGTVFVINKELANGIVSGKYFWFYTSMALLTIVAVPIAIIKRKGRVHLGFVDLLFVLFCCATIGITLIHTDRLTSKCLLLICLMVFYFYLKIFLSGKSKLAVYLLVLFFMFTGLVEAIWGLRQLYGFTASQHYLFKTTGSFFNPGPYSGWLAMVFPMALGYTIHGFTYPTTLYKGWRLKAILSSPYKGGVYKWLSDWLMIITGVLSAVCIILVLPVAMSRAAWLATLGGSAFIVVMYSIQNKSFLDYFRKHRKRFFVLSFIAVILFTISMIGLFMLKKDSASGRAFTWKIAMYTIVEHPSGVGLGNFTSSYGDIQAEYFASGAGTEREEYVAEGVEYAFNEYLQICVETGIIPFLVFLAFVGYTLFLGIRNKNYLPTGSLISLLIFASMSYPFNVLPFVIVFVFLCVLCISKDEPQRTQSFSQKAQGVTQWVFICVTPVIVGLCLHKVYPSYEAYEQWKLTQVLYRMNSHKKAVKEFYKQYPYLQDETGFLFEYAKSLFETKEYEKSNEVLQRATQISCDPMLYNMMGRNYQAMHEYDLAEAAFLKAANLVPTRLYPWYLLTKLYDEMGLKEKVYETAAIVQTKEPKVQSPAVTEMREEVEKLCEGTNRSVQELEKVLTHYKQNPADSLKYRAAVFLIENMSIHYYLQENAEYFDIMDSLNRSDLKNDDVYTRFDSIKKQTVTSPRVVFKDESLPSEFLIAHIDKSFANWESAPWKTEVGFEDFCEYILPYAVVTEKRELWTDYYREKYWCYLSGYTSDMSMADVCNMLNDSLKSHEVMVIFSKALQNYPPLSADYIRYGSCDNYAARTIYIMRSLGLPVGKDFVPQWGSYLRGHAWNTIVVENGYHRPFVGFDHNVGDWFFDNRFDCPKVYRNTYSIQKNSLAVRYAKEKIPNFLKQKNMKDVTSEYLPVSDISVSVAQPSDIQSEVAYLCVFNNTRWIPVHWGAVDDNTVIFTDMGRKVVYLPAFYDGKNFVAANSPFILDSLGNMLPLKADKRKKERLVLERKFHTRRIAEYYDRMINGSFQGANNPDFSDAEDLYVVTQRPKTVFNTADINTKKAWRYVRYLGDKLSHCNVAEIEFYSQQDGSYNKLSGEVIGTEGSYENNPELRKESVFDGDPLTYFDIPAVKGAWTGLDLGKQEQIACIRYLPRNDDNNIRPGDEYELFFWDKGAWNSLGKQTGTDNYVLKYDNCPSNALFLLHNHTRGQEERIFTYENEKQKWW